MYDASNNWELGLHCNSDCTFPLIMVIKSVTLMTHQKNCKHDFCKHFIDSKIIFREKLDYPEFKRVKAYLNKTTKKIAKSLINQLGILCFIFKDCYCFSVQLQGFEMCFL